MPDTIIQTAKDFWAIIGSVLAFVIWLVRLEAASKSNGRETARLEKEIARIERRLEQDRQESRAMLKEIREDIKILLQRRAGE